MTQTEQPAPDATQRSRTFSWTDPATVRLAERLGAEVVGLGFLIELSFLGGRAKLLGADGPLSGRGGGALVSLIEY